MGYVYIKTLKYSLSLNIILKLTKTLKCNPCVFFNKHLNKTNKNNVETLFYFILSCKQAQNTTHYS